MYKAKAVRAVDILSQPPLKGLFVQKHIELEYSSQVECSMMLGGREPFDELVLFK
jgi:hypothetical protein